MADVMNKPLQISTLKKIFHSLNPWGDEEDIDWESHIDSKSDLESNRTVLASEYPGYSFYEQEMVSPELEQLRESKRTISELKKRIKELEQIIPEEQINALRLELEKQMRIAREAEREIVELRRRKPEEVVPKEEYEKLRKDIEQVGYITRETSLKLELLRKRWEEEIKDKRRILPTPMEFPAVPETRVCAGEIPVGEVPTGTFDIFGKEIYEIISTPCMASFTIQNTSLEDKFLRLLIRSGRISTFAARMMKKMCPDCQRRQYGDTFVEMVCEDVSKGVIGRNAIYAIGLSLEEVITVCERAGMPISADLIL